MDFKEATKPGSCLSKDYAEDLFRLLAIYESISASEAASPLTKHIKTIPDFLEDMYNLRVLERKEVYEGNRPYFRYRLKTNQINMAIDLTTFSRDDEVNDSRLKLKIRETKNAGVKFTTSRSIDYISGVTIRTVNQFENNIQDA